MFVGTYLILFIEGPTNTPLSKKDGYENIIR